MRFGAHLGVHLDGYWGASWRQDGAKLANLAPRCAQDGQLGGQDCQLGALFGASWRPLLDLGRDLAKNCENQKTTTVQRFGRFFGVLGLVLEAMLGYLGAVLGYIGAMLAHLRAMLSHLGAILRQVGEKMAPKIAKTSQENEKD